MKTIYRHYGHTCFDSNIWKDIKNREYFDKPSGGIWASRETNKDEVYYSWKDWCKDNFDFKPEKYNTYFDFMIKDNAKILLIDNLTKLRGLPTIKNDNKDKLDLEKYIKSDKEIPDMCILLDFEKISKVYDVIEYREVIDNRLHWVLYGWDCDSLLILNKEVIEELK